MMRIARGACLSALFVAPNALAEPPPDATPQADDGHTEPLLNRVEIAARGGIVLTASSVSPVGRSADALVGGEIAFHLSSSWRVGAYGEYLEDLFTDGDDRENLTPLFRFGARVQWHSRPARVVDPWIGFSIGALLGTAYNNFSPETKTTETGADVGADLGLDFRLGTHVMVGPLVSVVAPFWRHSSAGDLGNPPFPVMVSVPFPLLRLALTL